MIETFQARAEQNVQAAEALFDLGLYDACANRAYYACFHAAFVACLRFGVDVKPEHIPVLSRFCSELVSRRKVFPAAVKKALYDLQNLRIQADYENAPVSKNKAAQALKAAQNLTETILKGTR